MDIHDEKDFDRNATNMLADIKISTDG